MDKINIECKNINYEMLNLIKQICNKKTQSDMIICKKFLDELEKCLTCTRISTIIASTTNTTSISSSVPCLCANQNISLIFHAIR